MASPSNGQGRVRFDVVGGADPDRTQLVAIQQVCIQVDRVLARSGQDRVQIQCIGDGLDALVQHHALDVARAQKVLQAAAVLQVVAIIRSHHQLSAASRRTLRLQETVEGLSVVVLTYYGSQLVQYLAKGTKDLHHLNIDVVTAISSAEASLETVMAVRDQVISAYQEIMRMPI